MNKTGEEEEEEEEEVIIVHSPEIDKERREKDTKAKNHFLRATAAFLPSSLRLAVLFIQSDASKERERGKEKRGEIVRKRLLARLAHQQRTKRISQGRSISLLAQIQMYDQFIPDCLSCISYNEWC